MIFVGWSIPPTTIRDPLRYLYEAGSRWLPPYQRTTPLASAAAATFSSNVRSVVELSETAIFRTISDLMPGCFSAARWSRYSAARDLPVSAGPSSSTSSSRAANSSRAAPRGSYRTTVVPLTAYHAQAPPQASSAARGNHLYWRTGPLE